jgi:hypothetical protein
LSRRVLAALAIAVAFTRPITARAQTPAAVDSFPVLILEHQFRGGVPDSARIILDKRLVYRVELSGRSGLPDIRPPGRGTPAFSAKLEKESFPGRSRFEMYPFSTGVHFVWVTGLAPADTALLRIYSDPSGSEAAQARTLTHASHTWTIGFAAAGGFNSSFLLADRAPLSPSDTARSGMDAELGLVIASSANPVSAELGVSVEPIGGATTRGTWFFVEPRVRVIRRGTMEAAVLFHLAQGSFSRSLVNPVLLAGGVVLTQHLSHDPLGRGAALQLRYFYGSVRNVPAQGQHAHHILLGIVWKP